MDLSDKEIKNLIRQAQKGDKEAFASVYNLFFERIYKYVFFRTKKKEVAEDLASLVFLKVWQNLSKYKAKRNVKFSTWLFQVARFTLIDYYRQNKIQVSLTEIRELPGQDFTIEQVEINEVKKYLLLLPEDYQTVINLKYFQGFDYEQIAKIMGKTNVTVRVLSHRALKKISDLMNIKND